MKAPIIRIGNSRGIRIPKAILEQCGFGDSAELAVRSGSLVLTPNRRPREGWDAGFAAMAAASDDTPLLPETVDPSAEDLDWTW